MTTIPTTIRLAPQLKKEASDIANQLGTTLSTVITLYLKNDFLVKKWLSVKLRNEDGFTEEAFIDLEKNFLEAEKWIDVSKPYSDLNTLFSDLNNDAVKY